jgi:SSS family solute:Na+ symporter
LLFGICVIGAALLAPYLGEHVIDIIARIAGSFLGLLLGVYLMGMLVPRANTAGAVVGLVAGSVSLAWVWACTSISAWWYGAFTCLPAIAAGILASYLFSPPRPEQLEGLAFANRGPRVP